MPNIPISVCIIAKNEEKYIEGCLQKLQPYGMEIVVADTGSTDATREIAQRYADRVVTFTWCDDFSAARNYCASQASNDWILALDCDEYVEHIDLRELRQYMTHFPRCTGKITLNSIMHSEDGKRTYYQESLPRLYDRRHYRFRYPIHEMISLHDALDGDYETHETFYAPIEVLHYGYDIPPEEMRRKQERNLALLYHSLESENVRGAYTYYQIGQSEEILGHYDEACDAYEKCMELDGDASRAYIQKAVSALGGCYARAGRIEEAAEFMGRYQEQIRTPYYNFNYGQVLLLAGEHFKALVQLLTVASMPDKDSLGSQLATCYRHISNLYREFGEEQMAQTFDGLYEKCAAGQGAVLQKGV